MKRILLRSVPVLAVALAVVLVGFAPSTGVITDAEISAIVSNVDPGRIGNTALALQNFRTRQSCSDQPEPGHGVTAARDFIFNQIQLDSRPSSKAGSLCSSRLSNLANFQRNRLDPWGSQSEPAGDHRGTLRFAHH